MTLPATLAEHTHRHRRLSSRLLWGLLAATAAAAALSVLAMQWCRVNGWSDPEQHIYMCYSDFSLLFSERGLAAGLLPLVEDVPEDQVMEYPVLIVLLAGALAQVVLTILPPDQAGTDAQVLLFYDVNHLAAVACWAGVVVITACSAGRRRGDALMVALAPGIILTISVNWDIWAVFLGGFGLLLFGRGRSVWAGVLLGLGAAMKLYPLLFLGAILVVCVRSGRLRSLAAVAAAGAGTWLAVNLPFILTSFDQWATFYRFSSEREISFSSMWLAFVWTGWSGETFSLISNGLFLLCCLGVAYLGWASPVRPRLAQLCFLIVASFLLLGKVYSPQFVIWLVPLVVLASPRVRDFVLWQAAEVFHWASVWLISATITAEQTGGDFGEGHYVFEVLYGLGIVAHMAAVIWLMLRVVGDIIHPQRDPVAELRPVQAGQACQPVQPVQQGQQGQQAPGTQSVQVDRGDPLAGRTAGQDDVFTLPGLGRSASLRLRW